jgi:hypothetical protein
MVLPNQIITAHLFEIDTHEMTLGIFDARKKDVRNAMPGSIQTKRQDMTSLRRVLTDSTCLPGSAVLSPPV